MQLLKLAQNPTRLADSFFNALAFFRLTGIVCIKAIFAQCKLLSKIPKGQQRASAAKLQNRLF